MLWFLLACVPPSEVDVMSVDSLSLEVQGSLVLASWEQPVDGDPVVAFRVADEDWRVVPARARAAGAQQQWLPGLPFEVEVEVRVGGEQAFVTTEPAQVGAPTFTATGDPDLQDPDVQFVLLSTETDTGMGTFIVDRQGRVVWERATPARRTTLHPRVGGDGRTLLIDHNTFWALFDGGAESSIVRVDLLGDLEEIATPGLHHPFVERADGVLAWSAINGTNDLLVERTPDGETSTLWSCLDFLEDRGSMGECGANTLWYDADAERYLFSFYSLETVFEIDGTTGETLRWFGHAGGAWDFDGAPFWWQHGAYYTEAGTLLVSSKDEDEARETVVREYALDPDSEVLELVWEAGVGEGVYGSVMGEAYRLDSGNTLHNLGSAARVREYDTDSVVVWDLSWDANTLGRSEPLGDLFALLPDP